VTRCRFHTGEHQAILRDPPHSDAPPAAAWSHQRRNGPPDPERKHIMKTIEQNLEPRALTDAELDQISGGGIFSRIGNFLRGLFGGPGDLRRSTDRPN
jgi:hypothetical protein